MKPLRRRWLLVVLVLVTTGVLLGPCFVALPPPDELPETVAESAEESVAEAARPERRRARTAGEPASTPDDAVTVTRSVVGVATTGTPDAPSGEEPRAPEPATPATPRDSSADPDTGDLRITVTDGVGAGREGAHVIVVSKIDGEFGRTHSVPTDAGGRADARRIAPGRISVTVEIGSLRRKLWVPIEAGLVTERHVEIPPGATVEGVVRHRDKGPLAGIWVSVGEMIRTSGASHHDQFRATTDSNGRYRLDEVPAGTHLVSLRGDAIGYHPRPRDELVVSGPGRLVRDFTLGEVSLEGVVRDAKTRAPIPGATVQIQSPLYYSETTGADGAYAFLDLPPGNYRMVVQHDGHGRVFMESGAIEAERRHAVDIELHPASTLLVSVSNAAGDPLGGSFVLGVTPLDEGSTSGGSSTFSVGGDGRARYSRILPGTYTLSLRGDGFETHRQRVDVRMGDNEVAFQMVRAAKTARRPGEVLVRGTVRDARTGDPIAGVRVTVGGSSPPQWFTDDEGRYELAVRWHGKRRMSMSRDGYGFHWLEPVKIEPDSDRVIDAKLEPAATVRMRVRGPTGAAIVGRLTFGISPIVKGTGTRVSTGVRADTDGVVVYSQILPARYRLRIVKDGVGRAEIETEVFPGENDLVFDLE